MARFVKLFIVLALWTAAATPGYAQYSHWFEIPSTWNVRIGATSYDDIPTLAERIDYFNNNPTAGSTNLINDLNTYHFSFWWGANNGTDGMTTCYATNSDPLRTVAWLDGTTDTQFFQRNDAGPDGSWLTLRIPDDCSPPTGNDGLTNIVNVDDPDHIWAFFQLRKRVAPQSCPGNVYPCWRADNVRRFARTKVQAQEDEAFGHPTGRAMGVDSIYEPFSGAQGACHGSAAYPHGAIHKEDFDAGELSHAFAIAIFRESNWTHNKKYPCRVPWTTVWDPNNVDDANYGPVRQYAAWMGERIMLNPALDIDSLDVGTATKMLLKGAQIYGYIPTDSTGEGIMAPYPHWEEAAAADIRIVGSSFASIGAFRAYLLGNSREMPCQPAFPNECDGADPPPNFPTEPDPVVYITTTTMPNGQDDVSYSADICATSGTQPYTWQVTVGSLPTGLSLGTPAANCVPVSGTPTTPNTYNFTVEVEDAVMDTDTQALSIVIVPASDPPPGDPDEPVVSGAIGFTVAAGPSPNTASFFWPGPITLEWARDSDLLPNGTTVYLRWRCNDRQWHTFASVDIEFGDPVSQGASGAISVSGDTYRIGRCSTLQFQIAAPRNGVNWGQETPDLDIKGPYSFR